MRLTVGYGTFDGGKYTLPTDVELREHESARRWRAAFGKEGGCDNCEGTGRVTIPGDDWNECPEFSARPTEVVDCYECIGTGRGEHER